MNVTFLFLLLLTFAQTVSADFYALIIGIDNYKNVGMLDGAVNDATIIADSLGKIGAKKVKLLLNEHATRTEIKQAWDDLVKEAKAGDSVFFTYAGHGAQQKERIPATEEDGKDELYILTNFEASGPNTYERIVDDDLQSWFSQVPDLKIILVSDSCHSGTMTRGYKKSNLKYRKIQFQNITDDALPLIEDKNIIDERKTKLDNVVSFSAVRDFEEVPEVRIGNKQHGALSWHLAQGLLGFADANKDGTIDVSEIKDYLIERVRMETEGQQHPQINFKDNKPLVALKAVSLTPKNNFSFQESLPIAVTRTTAQINSILEHLKGITVVTDNSAILTWDTEENVLENRFSDTVYTLPAHNQTTRAFKRSTPNNVEQDQAIAIDDTVKAIQPVINKFRIVEQAKRLSDASLKIALQPDDKLHANGENISFVVDNLHYPYFTLFNLATDGTVNFLYPNAEFNDSPSIATDRPYKLDLTVSAPFGADYFIAIASQQPLTALHESLKQMQNTSASLDKLSEALENALKDDKYQIGTHASFTIETKL